MKWDRRLRELSKRIPPARRTDLGLCELMEDVVRWYGGTRRPDGCLATVNFADGKVYHLAEYPNPIMPQLAAAILRQAGL